MKSVGTAVRNIEEIDILHRRLRRRSVRSILLELNGIGNGRIRQIRITVLVKAQHITALVSAGVQDPVVDHGSPWGPGRCVVDISVDPADHLIPFAGDDVRHPADGIALRHGPIEYIGFHPSGSHVRIQHMDADDAAGGGIFPDDVDVGGVRSHFLLRLVIDPPQARRISEAGKQHHQG